MGVQVRISGRHHVTAGMKPENSHSSEFPGAAAAAETTLENQCWDQPALQPASCVVLGGLFGQIPRKEPRAWPVTLVSFRELLYEPQLHALPEGVLSQPCLKALSTPWGMRRCGESHCSVFPKQQPQQPEQQWR